MRQATISGFETGKIQRIEFPMLERIAKALGVEPGELFVATIRILPCEAA